MPPQPKLADAEVNVIVAAYLSGVDGTKLAHVHGVNRQTIYNVLSRRGVRRHRSRVRIATRLKRCGVCKMEKPFEQFRKGDYPGPGLSALTYMCRECCQAYDRRKGYTFRKNTGITPAQFEVLSTQQGGVCAICRESSQFDLQVDHDHPTGEIRGLLCRRCNTRLIGVDAGRKAGLVAKTAGYTEWLFNALLYKKNAKTGLMHAQAQRVEFTA